MNAREDAKDCGGGAPGRVKVGGDFSACSCQAGACLPSPARNAAGFSINFGAATFKEGIKRIVHDHRDFAPSRIRVNQNI